MALITKEMPTCFAVLIRAQIVSKISQEIIYKNYWTTKTTNQQNEYKTRIPIRQDWYLNADNNY